MSLHPNAPKDPHTRTERARKAKARSPWSRGPMCDTVNAARVYEQVNKPKPPKPVA